MLDKSTKSQIIETISDLISIKSVTPDEGECIEYVKKYLEALNFKTNILKYNKTSNIYASLGSGKNLCFLGHTDVVPVQNLELWSVDPFKLTLKSGKCYGRGTSDMKGTIGCFLVALKDVLAENKLNKQISVFITGDEEGDGNDGVKRVVREFLEPNAVKIDYCLIGEPTGECDFLDCVKYGRRGSVNFEIKFTGQGGHIAYPQNFVNPITSAVKVANALRSHIFDTGNEFFEPTNLEVRNFDAVNPVSNMIPRYAVISFNIRYSNLHSLESISKQVENIIKESSYCEYEITNSYGADGYFSKESNFSKKIHEIINKISGKSPVKSTTGGVTDGRFINHICENIYEIGTTAKMAHKIDEFVDEEEFYVLYSIYKQILVSYLNDSF